MASIHKEAAVMAGAEHIWAAVRDVGNIHVRLVPGFVADCRLDGDARIVTFANGLVLREPIVSIDDARHRLAWAAIGEPFKHYNASLQIFAEGADRARLVWIADFLPNDLQDTVDAMIDEALAVMQQTLERSASG